MVPGGFTKFRKNIEDIQLYLNVKQTTNSFFSSIIIWGKNGTYLYLKNYLLYLKFKLNWCPILNLAIFLPKAITWKGKS